MSRTTILTIGIDGLAVTADDRLGRARVIRSTSRGVQEIGQPYLFAESGKRNAIIAAVSFALDLEEASDVQAALNWAEKHTP